MWFFTVPSLRYSRVAISRLVAPRAMSRRTSTSRAVSDCAGLADEVGEHRRQRRRRRAAAQRPN
jgi:hypothetical protein